MTRSTNAAPPRDFNAETMMKLFRFLALAVLALAAGAHAENRSIATGGTGGVYYPMGGGLAAVLSKNIPGMAATAEVTGGSVDNLKLIGTGKPYMAFTMSDAAKDAQDGLGKFANSKVDLRTLLVLYPNRMHVVTVDSTGIKTMKDLKGKRVSTGSPGSATELMAFRLMEAAGIDKDKDVKRERLGVAESVNAIKDRKIDAFFWVGGLPTAAVTDLANTPGTKIVMIDNADEVAAMNKKYGNLYFTKPIAAWRRTTGIRRSPTSWSLVPRCPMTRRTPSSRPFLTTCPSWCARIRSIPTSNSRTRRRLRHPLRFIPAR